MKQPAQSLECVVRTARKSGRSPQRNLRLLRRWRRALGRERTAVRGRRQSSLHRLDDTNLFITSNSGLYASKDAGRNWNRADIRDLQFQDAAGSGNALVVSAAATRLARIV